MNQKNSEIVPVTYLGGTGGNFLSWFISLAQRNDNTIMQFSEHGNAHASPYACHGDNNRQAVDDNIKIHDLLEQGPRRFPNTVWYPNVHLKNLSLAANQFERAIRITLDEDDCDTLISIMTGKVRLDLNILKLEDIDKNHFNRKQTLLDWLPMYQVEPFDNVLFVPFKDMMYNSADVLVNKLAEFTSIPAEHFNKSNLLAWRMKTSDGIKHINTYR